MKLIQERNKSVTYKEARVYLDELSKYGSVLGLDAIRGLLRELGNPQDDLRFIHIAGTNGKGSVLAYTSTILSEAGYRIGRYVSPTVVSYRERIQVDGEMISKHAFAEETEKVQDAIVRLKEAGKQLPTVFEAETAIAFLYYKRMKCDFVVLESGLGGMEDATNVVKNTVCVVFSPISMDHIGVIGNTLSEIAENKAGIIKPGCIVVSAPQKQEVREILEQKARQFGCPIIYAEPEKAVVLEEDYRGMRFSYKDSENISIRLSGKYQLINAVTAWEAVHVPGLLKKEEKRAVETGFFDTEWFGRFTCISERPVFPALFPYTTLFPALPGLAAHPQPQAQTQGKENRSHHGIDLSGPHPAQRGGLFFHRGARARVPREHRRKQDAQQQEKNTREDRGGTEEFHSLFHTNTPFLVWSV